jgi:CDP-glucose 4,6-dehydratase
MNDSLVGFYHGRTVLVTGHTGFKGGWLSVWLKLLGARVIGFSLPPEKDRPSFYEAAGVARETFSFFGDIRDANALLEVMYKHPPEIIFHNAAQPLVLRSYDDPVETYATNVMGTVHVLEAARKVRSVRSVIIVTSDKCYENWESPRGYREDDPMGGHDPYSSSKGCAELVTAACRRSFFENAGSAGVASVRAGNVIGGGDWADNRLVPDIIRGIASGKPVYIRHPEAIRPWQHVLEPLRGYLILAQRLWNHEYAFAQAWNFGPSEDDAISVRQLAEMTVAHWGQGTLCFQENGKGPHEAANLTLDCSKARTRLGWRPLLSTTQALRYTVDWYRAYLSDSSAGLCITARQIECYSEMCP